MKTVSGADFRRAMPAAGQEWLGEYEAAVRPIVEGVRRGGDKAVAAYTQEFDGVTLAPERILVTPDEIEAAWAAASDECVAAIAKARDNVKRFHEKQLPKSWMAFGDDGSLLGQVVRPLDRVGIYVPGGTAAYPSSVVMCAVPAAVAGVREVFVCTPPGKGGSVNPLVLVAADMCGVGRVFKVGGAQAIAAMAFGTETIPQARKIVGPGNAYVTAAKRMVYGYVDIDMLAGPTEVMVIADSTADPEIVAADLLSQAEHDPLARAVLVTTSPSLAASVEECVARQIEALPRREVAKRSLDQGGFLVIAQDLAEAVEIANCYAPEHLEILVEEALSLLPMVRNAGGIFIGRWSPVAAGDYCAGPNHVLPTGGSAASFSALSTSSFVKVSNLAALSREALADISRHVAALARAEGLVGHAISVEMRSERS